MATDSRRKLVLHNRFQSAKEYILVFQHCHISQTELVRWSPTICQVPEVWGRLQCIFGTVCQKLGSHFDLLSLKYGGGNCSTCQAIYFIEIPYGAGDEFIALRLILDSESP